MSVIVTPFDSVSNKHKNAHSRKRLHSVMMSLLPKMDSTNENTTSNEVSQSVVETVELKTNEESVESKEPVEVASQSEGDLKTVIEIVDEQTEESGSNETVENTEDKKEDGEKEEESKEDTKEDELNEEIKKEEDNKEGEKEEEKKEEDNKEDNQEEESKEEGEKTEKKEQPDEWTLIGSVCLTPCGHGVVSQRTDDGTAIVLLVATLIFIVRFIRREEEKAVRLASGYFSISSLRKPTFEKTPPAYVILRAQVLRDVCIFADHHI